MTAINKVTSIFFSSTNTSKKVANTVAVGTGLSFLNHYNITQHNTDSIAIEPDTFAIFATPVYGGKIPAIATERIKRIKGEGAFAAVIVVYGNRDYDHALEELASLVRQQGFKVIAAATFIGEHSYSTTQYPISVGRPNKNDLDTATTFGQRIAKKIAEGALQEINVTKIQRPKQPFWATLRFIANVIKLRRSKVTIPPTPSIVNVAACTRCEACVKQCPTQAITLGNELTIDASRCIRCCACVKVCPQKVRTYDTPFSKLLATSYSKEKQPQMLL